MKFKIEIVLDSKKDDYSGLGIQDFLFRLLAPFFEHIYTIYIETVKDPYCGNCKYYESCDKINTYKKKLLCENHKFENE